MIRNLTGRNSYNGMFFTTESVPMRSALVWFRRDLRCFDHAALSHALQHYDRVHCCFVFDTRILDALPGREDRRVEFIWRSLLELDQALDQLSRAAGGAGAGMLVRHGAADELLPQLAQALQVEAVLTNRDYEPEAMARDARVRTALAESDIAFHDCKDIVIFERDEVLTQAGQAFSVFSPYRNAWLKRFGPADTASFPVADHAAALAPKPADETLPSLSDIGFAESGLTALKLPVGMSGGKLLFDDFCKRIDRYKQARDYPAVRGVSYLSTHLRFGTVSIRELARYAADRGGEGAQGWLAELIWRDFYHMILWHHPRVVTDNFKPDFDRVRWDEAPELFAAWCEGRTGYPLVDAAMRQLNTTGFMHNRLRMVSASFLTKDLGVDWRLGERYFADRLNDYDLAANNGGWQWAASTGCDAQPWFRIFNPVTQSERFDPDGRFIRRYLPELERVPAKFIHAPWKMGGIDQQVAGVRIGHDYPAPIVDHAQAREKTLARFAVTKG